MLNNCIPPEAFFYGVSDATGKRMLQAANNSATMPTDGSAYTAPAPEGKWFVYDPTQQNAFLTPAGNTTSTNSSAAQEAAEASPSYVASLRGFAFSVEISSLTPPSLPSDTMPTRSKSPTLHSRSRPLAPLAGRSERSSSVSWRSFDNR